jgi:hypothetical protein
LISSDWFLKAIGEVGQESGFLPGWLVAVVVDHNSDLFTNITKHMNQIFQSCRLTRAAYGAVPS